MGKNIVIGTRGSKLALWQAHRLQSRLKEIGLESELKIIKTKGDLIQNLSFDKIEGKGFFTKEIENALLANEVDVAVHSLKDMPTEHPEGLSLSGLSEREDPSDILILNKDAIDSDRPLSLKKDAIIGTSSARRKAQIKSLAPEIILKDIRGNVPTRLSKLSDGDFDGIILASAGINRLELDISEFKSFRFNPKEFVPAPGQGVMAYQCKTDDIKMRRIIKQIHVKETAQCTNIERSILKLMGGGCHTPLGAFTEIDSRGNYLCTASYAPTSKDTPNRISLSQSTWFELAEKIVDQLKK